MDSLFEVVAAKPKAMTSKEDAPVVSSMRASAADKIRRNPSTDQKKVRRSMNKKASGEYYRPTPGEDVGHWNVFRQDGGSELNVPFDELPEEVKEMINERFAAKTAGLSWKHQDGYGWYLNPADLDGKHWAQITEHGDDGQAGGATVRIYLADGDDITADSVVAEDAFGDVEGAKQYVERFIGRTASKTAGPSNGEYYEADEVYDLTHSPEYDENDAADALSEMDEDEFYDDFAHEGAIRTIGSTSPFDLDDEHDLRPLHARAAQAFLRRT